MNNLLIKITFFSCLLVFSYNGYAGMLGASNIYECLLDKMPGVKNDATAVELYKICKKEFPISPEYVEKKKTFFGVKTTSECIIKHAENVTSPKAAQWIRHSCYKLYEKD